MIKCLMFKNYGGYGFDVHNEIYRYIDKHYANGVADHILEQSEYGEYYMIINYQDDSTRFNTVLIEAFENTHQKYHNGYEVVEGEFTCKNYDGKESEGKIIFYDRW